ncbi:MAG: ABC transporter ATP-binding protein [Brachymonas sp.]|nr:ABC transporter ATP-binding protein [Brachymonas sp.]
MPALPTPPNDGLIFKAQGLTKVYRMGDVQVHALRGIDLELRAGDFVVILGPSGSGKSTLLNILGGLDVPSSGQMCYHGEDLTQANDARLTRFRREHVGFVFQFYNLIPSLTARENVAIVTDIAPHPLPPAQALELVGLGQRLDHFPAQLSGGEQQRVAIARAIAKRPVVMLCDEPTGALDSATGVRVLEALDRVNRDMGTTTIIITHNADIARMAQRVLWMQDGRIVREQVNAERLAAHEIKW